MRGVNTGAWSGNVGSRISFGTTDDGTEACSFDLAVESKGAQVVWTRVNVFGPGLVALCRERLHQGGYAQVVGGLMNRRRHTEIRAEQLIFGGAPDARVPVRTVPSGESE